MGNGDPAPALRLRRGGQDDKPHHVPGGRGRHHRRPHGTHGRRHHHLELRRSHGATGPKTYADGTHEDTTYNALNLKSTLTDARGIVTTWGYNLKKGVNNSVSYSDSTPGIQYAYNYLNQLTRVTDASGSRSLAYTQYNEQDTDTITIGGSSYQLQEHYDTYGRSSGYTLKQGTDVLQEASQGYEANGRLASAGIMHEGTEQSFAYGYLAGKQPALQPCDAQ